MNRHPNPTPPMRLTPPVFEPEAWIETYTGRQFHFLSPLATSVDPVDIGHALSNQCRYAGHVKRFYSVAEHSVLVATWLMATYGDVELALQGLLHDGSEAYLVDIPRPIKPFLVGYAELERRINKAVMARFNLPAQLDKRVKEADNRILVDERAALMSSSENKWFSDSFEPLGVHVVGWPPSVAKDNFLNKLAELLMLR